MLAAGFSHPPGNVPEPETDSSHGLATGESFGLWPDDGHRKNLFGEIAGRTFGQGKFVSARHAFDFQVSPVGHEPAGTTNFRPA